MTGELIQLVAEEAEAQAGDIDGEAVAVVVFVFDKSGRAACRRGDPQGPDALTPETWGRSCDMP